MCFCGVVGLLMLCGWCCEPLVGVCLKLSWPKQTCIQLVWSTGYLEPDCRLKSLQRLYGNVSKVFKQMKPLMKGNVFHFLSLVLPIEAVLQYSRVYRVLCV